MRRRLCQATAAALLALLAAAATPPSIAAARAVDEDFQPWLQLFVDGRSGERLRWSLDLQSRWLDVPQARDAQTGKEVDSSNTVILIRPAVGWALADWITIWAGYAYQPVFFYNPDLQDARDTDEHRAWEQFSLSHREGAWGFGLRSRLEQRYRTDGPGDGEWAHRFRQQARAAYELSFDRRWQLVLWDEVFFHLNDTDYPSNLGLDQNRAFAGAAFRPIEWLTLEGGYLTQFVRRYSDPHQVNHILLLQISVAVTTPSPF